MAKTQEELNTIKEEIETLNKKLAELTEEELKQVYGGVGGGDRLVPRDVAFRVAKERDDAVLKAATICIKTDYELE